MATLDRGAVAMAIAVHGVRKSEILPKRVATLGEHDIKGARDEGMRRGQREAQRAHAWRRG
jgi:hypothetical protein